MNLPRFSILMAAVLACAATALAEEPAAAPFPPLPQGVDWMRYDRASEVQLRDIAAVVYVVPESRPDVAVAVVHRGGVPGIELSTHGRRLLVDGRLEHDIEACRVEPGGAFQVRLGSGWRSAETLPAIYLRVPLEAVISASGATRLEMRRGQSLRLALKGCGDADIEGVDGAADISLAGDRPSVRLYDSGAASIRVAGDGDILLGVVRESLAVSIAGSGDFVAAHVDGPTTVAIAGDGQAVIREGRAQPMSVTIMGEGSVVHNGEADRLDVAIFGEGDVRVRQVTGPVNRRVFGDGEIVIGDGS